MNSCFIILTAAMALGGMSMLAWDHYHDVENEVMAFHEVREEAVEQAELAQVNERLASQMTELKDTVMETISQERKAFKDDMILVKSDVIALQQNHKKQDLWLSRLGQNYQELEFSVETHSESFRPLPSTNSRFQQLQSFEESASLLPPVDTGVLKRL